MGLLSKIAKRSRWLAKRLWLVMVAEVLLTTRRYVKRLEPEERRRLLELARKSEGRPQKNLSAKERREASTLLDKLGHIEYAGDVAGIVLPFRPLSRLATKFLSSRQKKARELVAEDEARAAGERVAAPAESAPPADSKA